MSALPYRGTVPVKKIAQKSNETVGGIIAEKRARRTTKKQVNDAMVEESA